MIPKNALLFTITILFYLYWQQMHHMRSGRNSSRGHQELPTLNNDTRCGSAVVVISTDALTWNQLFGKMGNKMKEIRDEYLLIS